MPHAARFANIRTIGDGTYQVVLVGADGLRVRSFLREALQLRNAL